MLTGVLEQCGQSEAVLARQLRVVANDVELVRGCDLHERAEVRRRRRVSVAVEPVGEGNYRLRQLRIRLLAIAAGVQVDQAFGLRTDSFGEHWPLVQREQRDTEPVGAIHRVTQTGQLYLLVGAPPGQHRPYPPEMSE